MVNDPYSSCSCGSGKKFKWCCQPIHDACEKVYSLDAAGQHEAAARMMDQLVAEHATNPEAWGRKALLLANHGKREEAEAALDKAFELFPTYPFGYFLKAQFRLAEGEIAGALLLFRKAAELYDANAREMLSDINVEIFKCEMSLNHPIAAHAAAELALRFAPENDKLRSAIATVFGEGNPNFPPSATQTYAFKLRPASANADRQSAWDEALKTAATGKLSDATKAFEKLTQGDQVEAAAWFNLALCQAWAGNNAAGVLALDRYVALEPDETQAAQGWALAEILRFGQGMEDQADVVEHSIVFAVRDPGPLTDALNELAQAGLLTRTHMDEQQGILTTTILETPGPALTPELAAQQSMKIGAYVHASFLDNVIRLWQTQREGLERVFAHLRQKLGDSLLDFHAMRGPARFTEVLSEAIEVPRNALSQEEALKRVQADFEKFYEGTWISRRLKSLGNLSPADAVAQPTARKKLRGVLQVMGECCAMVRYPYDFNRLRSKLGLLDAPAASVVATDQPRKVDIASLGAAELTSLATESLSAAELDLAYQTAVKLDARELAGTFAALLVERPAYPERRDRFPLYQLLINQTLAQGKADEALDYLNDGERDDCENNEGKRRNEYELRRAQVHAKRGEFEQAQDVYDRLIARVPTELNYRVNAAETMLSAREKTRALKFAQDGLAVAVKQNNRDLEGHFKELMSAAKR